MLEGVSRVLQVDDAERGLSDLVRTARVRPYRSDVQQLLDAMDVPVIVRKATSTPTPSNDSVHAVFSEMYVQPQRPADFGQFMSRETLP
ncbi:hypothetical protein [Rhodococcus opacus]|uniref:hypothetical protein n=1 Tax=Rhodococcus opacus TaxID=37919 RepID=UPI002473AC0F|nr:hypothetical protein [Rhodococcus opacus]MDH6293081.1 hypothetical protein [Rhodococcus opacus]